MASNFDDFNRIWEKRCSYTGSSTQQVVDGGWQLASGVWLDKLLLCHHSTLNSHTRLIITTSHPFLLRYAVSLPLMLLPTQFCSSSDLSSSSLLAALLSTAHSVPFQCPWIIGTAFLIFDLFYPLVQLPFSFVLDSAPKSWNGLIIVFPDCHITLSLQSDSRVCVWVPATSFWVQFVCLPFKQLVPFNFLVAMSGKERGLDVCITILHTEI